jgi:hypothetical protein
VAVTHALRLNEISLHSKAFIPTRTRFSNQFETLIISLGVTYAIPAR